MAVRVPNGRPITPSGLPLRGMSLNVPFHRQRTKNWCWAACTQMLAAYYHRNAAQCESATFLFSGYCCDYPNSFTCNQPCSSRQVGMVYRHWGISSHHRSERVGLNVLQSEIRAGRPVEVGFTWTIGGKHVVLITGYYDNGFVSVHDPDTGPKSVSYSAVCTAYGQGFWSDTWLDLE